MCYYAASQIKAALQSMVWSIFGCEPKKKPLQPCICFVFFFFSFNQTAFWVSGKAGYLRPPILVRGWSLWRFLLLFRFSLVARFIKQDSSSRVLSLLGVLTGLLFEQDTRSVASVYCYARNYQIACSEWTNITNNNSVIAWTKTKQWSQCIHSQQVIVTCPWCEWVPRMTYFG